MLCSVCHTHKGGPTHANGVCVHCIMLAGSFAAVEHSLQAIDRFTSSDVAHFKLLVAENPRYLGNLFSRAIEATIEFGLTIPWDGETEAQAIKDTVTAIFRLGDIFDCDPHGLKKTFDAIPFPAGVTMSAASTIPLFTDPDCDECKGTGWYVGFLKRERCKTC